MSVIVPTWNRRDLVDRCLHALAAQTRPADEVIIVDNGSVDGTAAQITRNWPDVRIVHLATNHGFAGGCNAGFRSATGDRLVLLNNDARPDPSWLAELLAADAAAPAAVAAVSSKLLLPDGRIESSGDFLTRWALAVQRGHGTPDDGRYDRCTEIFSACGGAALFRRDALADVGLFDEAFFAYFEDLDLSFRLRLAGRRVVYAARAVVRHDVGSTGGRIRGFRTYHSLRNPWWLVLKNVPGSLLGPVLLRLTLMQLRWLAGAARRRELGVALRAHRDALLGLPRVLRQRRSIQAYRRVAASTVADWLPRNRTRLIGLPPP